MAQLTNDTRNTILDAGEELMKGAGYAGFSYAGIAEAVGIRKASIHYHFPNKADLAEEAVERYRRVMRGALGSPIDMTSSDAIGRVGAAFDAAYAGPGGACLCAALVADWAGLPGQVQEQVRLYWSETSAWLAAAISNDAPDLDERRALELGRQVLSLFEGALLTARVLADPGALVGARSSAITLVEDA